MKLRHALSIAAIAALLAPARIAFSLDPLPVVESGPGFKTWMVETHHPLLKLEDVLHDLRSPDRRVYEKALDDLGLHKFQEGRVLEWPELEPPIEARTSFLSFERRKLAVLTAPLRGHHRWLAVLLRQEGSGEAYWRAVQCFEFDTDPVEGYAQEFPDINGDDIRFFLVHHMHQDNVQGRARVVSIFRYDEKRLRLVYHEVAGFYGGAKFQGKSLKQEQQLVFDGKQHIRRKLSLTVFPFMKREEFENYEGVKPAQAPAGKVSKVEERFAWNPADFNFYDNAQELEKLVTHKSPLIRRDAARRLGENMRSTHKQLENAMLKDKDMYVRMQCALALENIGDTAALPSVKKALLNVDEPDEMREALQRAEKRLEAAKSEKNSKAEAAMEGKPKKAKKEKKGEKAQGAPAPQSEPKLSDKR